MCFAEGGSFSGFLSTTRQAINKAGLEKTGSQFLPAGRRAEYTFCEDLCIQYPFSFHEKRVLTLVPID